MMEDILQANENLISNTIVLFRLFTPKSVKEVDQQLT